MKKYITLLGILLIIQAVLIGLGFRQNQDSTTFANRKPLLSFDAASIDTIIIEGRDNATVTLNKVQDNWQIKDSFNAPANSENVKTLLDTLAAMRTSWPVATTPGAATRFKVAEDAFERHILLKTGDTVAAELFVGTSPSFRKVHVRLPDSNDIMTAEFAVFEAGTTAKEWLDSHLLNFAAEKVQKITLNDITLIRQDNTMTVADLQEGEQVNADKVEELVKRLADLQIDDIAGIEEKPEYGLDKPVLTCSIDLEDTAPVTWTFGAKDDKEKHILKTSDNKLLFTVQNWRIKPLLEATREQLVTTPTTETTPQQEKKKSKETNK